MTEQEKELIEQLCKAVSNACAAEDVYKNEPMLLDFIIEISRLRKQLGLRDNGEMDQIEEIINDN